MPIFYFFAAPCFCVSQLPILNIILLIFFSVILSEKFSFVNKFLRGQNLLKSI